MTKERLILTFCILFAGLLWIPQKLSKRYTHHTIIPVSVMTPTDVMIASKPVHHIPLMIEGNGNQLIKLETDMHADTIFMNWRDEGNQLEYYQSEILAAIREHHQMAKNINLDTDVARIDFSFDSLATKRVRIYPDLHLDFRSGFGIAGPFLITPDSIDVAGPREILVDLDSIRTQPVYQNDVQEDIHTMVTPQVTIYDQDGPHPLRLSTHRIEVKVPVDLFVEKVLIVPLQRQDDSSRLRIFPDHVSIKLSIPTDRYSSVDADDIRVDLSPVENQSMTVRITSLPPYTRYISHTPKLIRYYQRE